MFSEAFEKIEPADVPAILDKINPLVEGIIFDAAETIIMGIDIPFYKGYRLLDIADYSSMPASRRFVAYSAKNAVALNFTNEPIYKLNQEVPIKLTEDNIADYVRFFFSFVRGKHGHFLITESIDDIHWKEDPPPAARKAIGKMIMPISVVRKEPDGSYIVQASMMFKDSLFKSDINISASGTVHIHNEELLIEDMPVQDDTFGQ